MKWKIYALAAMMAGALFVPQAQANASLNLAEILELSGTGATAGTNFKNGVELAVKEINAAGGILGYSLHTEAMDTQSNPAVAKGLVQKAVDQNTFAIFGPVFSDSVMVSMNDARRAQIPMFTGGEAANLTQQGNPFLFRTSLTQSASMPKIARYITEETKIKRLALIYVNNDFGIGGRDTLTGALAQRGSQLATTISTDPGQVDFSAAVLKVKQAHADAVFVYCNEEESARVLRELRKQGWNKPIIGETTLAGQKVIELAGAAANGVIAHVGLTTDAPVPTIQTFRSKFQKAYGYIPDHNGLKGYLGVYILKAAIEHAGKPDRVAVAKLLHGLTIRVTKTPGVLLDLHYDNRGDLDRKSFLVQVRNGKQQVLSVLPALNPF